MYNYQKKRLDGDLGQESSEDEKRSERSVEEDQLWDEAPTMKEAIENVLNKRDDYEAGLDQDKVKNDRLKLLAEKDFDLDCIEKNTINIGISKQDNPIYSIGVQNPESNATGGFKGFKKKKFDVNKKIASIGNEDFN